MTTRHDVTVTADGGDVLAVRWLDPNGDPYDLSTAEVTSHVRRRFATGVLDPAPIGEFTGVGDEEGWVHVSLTPDQAAVIPAGTYVFDVLVVTATARKRLVVGQVTKEPHVTVTDEDEDES